MAAATNDVTTLDAPIVFQKDREEEGATDIYLLEPGSETPLQLTDDLAHDGHPALSPDGSTLAYSRWENGCTNIYLMDVETGVSELLTDTGLGAYCHNDQPTWSPDGTQLAFVTRPKGGRSSIFVANVDGTGGYSLVDDDYIDQAPAWSPDGTQLAFVSYRAARLPGGETGYPGTFIMDADDTAGTTIRQVGDVFDVEPDWSPDGTQLVVSNTSWSGGLLRLIDVSTGVGTPLGILGRHPTWDGGYLYYGASNLITLEPEVHRVKVDGSEETAISGTDKAAFPRRLKVLPQATSCTFVFDPSNPNAELHAFEADEWPIEWKIYLDRHAYDGSIEGNEVQALDGYTGTYTQAEYSTWTFEADSYFLNRRYGVVHVSQAYVNGQPVDVSFWTYTGGEAVSPATGIVAT
jgi:dipeptidyl aminopeptidase/acylaminoacyl peptidase